jgi:hypothetical protein
MYKNVKHKCRNWKPTGQVWDKDLFPRFGCWLATYVPIEASLLMIASHTKQAIQACPSTWVPQEANKMNSTPTSLQHSTRVALHDLQWDEHKTTPHNQSMKPPNNYQQGAQRSLLLQAGSNHQE